jgi:hypothetical protein
MANMKCDSTHNESKQKSMECWHGREWTDGQRSQFAVLLKQCVIATLAKMKTDNESPRSYRNMIRLEELSRDSQMRDSLQISREAGKFPRVQRLPSFFALGRNKPIKPILEFKIDNESLTRLYDFALHTPRCDEMFRTLRRNEEGSWVNEYDTLKIQEVVQCFVAWHFADRGYDGDERVIEQWSQLFADGIFPDRVNVEVWVPIIGLMFSEEGEFNDGLSIKEIPDWLQIERVKHKVGINIFDDPGALGAATHALVIRDHCIINYSHQNVRVLAPHVKYYPVRKIDDFFAVLRACTLQHTGYLQMLMVPQDFLVEAGELPGQAAYGVDVQKYYSSESVPEPVTIDTATAQTVYGYYQKLTKCNCSSIATAQKRLNAAFIGAKDSDSIIDSFIGLEALLLDAHEKDEVTLRFSLRVTALGKCMRNFRFPSKKLQELAKDLYLVRSALVHGDRDSKDAKKANNKILKMTNKNPCEVARELLSDILIVLLDNENLQEAPHITDLIYERLDSTDVILHAEGKQ